MKPQGGFKLTNILFIIYSFNKHLLNKTAIQTKKQGEGRFSKMIILNTWNMRC